MSVRGRALGLAAIALWAAGCASAPPRVTSYKPPIPAEGIVLVADGAGGNTEATRAFSNAVKKSRHPLYVRAFEWSHGPGRGVADVVDVAYAQDQGKRLAAHIAWYRASYPDKPIYLVGFSAGTHVVLEASRHLGPASVSRMFLIAPAVAADYDLRPALAAVENGVHVYYSERDQLYLGIGTAILGTADGQRGVPPAGRVGFDAPRAEPEFLKRLKQHPWEATVEWTGNDGEHDGALHTKYLRAYVLPLMR